MRADDDGARSLGEILQEEREAEMYTDDPELYQEPDGYGWSELHPDADAAFQREYGRSVDSVSDAQCAQDLLRDQLDIAFAEPSLIVEAW